MCRPGHWAWTRSAKRGRVLFETGEPLGQALARQPDSDKKDGSVQSLLEPCIDMARIGLTSYHLRTNASLHGLGVRRGATASVRISSNLSNPCRAHTISITHPLSGRFQTALLTFAGTDHHRFRRLSLGCLGSASPVCFNFRPCLQSLRRRRWLWHAIGVAEAASQRGFYARRFSMAVIPTCFQSLPRHQLPEIRPR